MRDINVFTSRAHLKNDLKNKHDGVAQGEAVQQLREALKILAERVLILEHMIGIHGKSKNTLQTRMRVLDEIYLGHKLVGRAIFHQNSFPKGEIKYSLSNKVYESN